MEIPDFYVQLLDLGLPWIVKEVVSEARAERVDVRLEFAGGAEVPCTHCGGHHPVHDYSSLRKVKAAIHCDRQSRGEQFTT